MAWGKKSVCSRTVVTTSMRRNSFLFLYSRTKIFNRLFAIEWQIQRSNEVMSTTDTFNVTYLCLSLRHCCTTFTHLYIFIFCLQTFSNTFYKKTPSYEYLPTPIHYGVPKNIEHDHFFQWVFPQFKTCTNWSWAK